jgi:hypothetical protein
MSIVQTLIVAVPPAALLVVVADRLMRAGNHGGRPARLLTVLWVPVLMILPWLGMCTDTEDMLSRGAVAAFSLGPLIAAVSIPLLLLGSRAWGNDQWHVDDHLPLAWPAVGVLLMALAVAGRVPEFLALVCFAFGAVLVWMETIPRTGEGHGLRGGGWIVLGLGSAGWLVAASHHAPSKWPMMAIALAVAAAIMMRASIRLGRRRAMLLAGWTGMLGPILAFGAIGQAGLRGAVLNATGDEVAFIGYRGMGGLEALLLPGLLLLASCGLLAGWPRWSLARGRWAAGLMAAIGVFAAAAMLAGLK